MTNQETTDRAPVNETLSAEDREILRQYREDGEELARRLLYRAHFESVGAIAADMLGAILRGEIDGPEALDERLHEEADSACTYTRANLRTVYASENWEAGPEELGSDAFAGAEDCGTLFGRLAYFAVRADIRERLELTLSHPPTPGSDEAKRLGFDADSIAGLDLEDSDTYPANRAEDGEPCECSDPGCSSCEGKCSERASARLRRVDFAGEPECGFCADCAADALESGCFGSVDVPEQPEEEGPSPEDYVISSNGFRLSVGIVEGAHVGEFAEDKEAEEAIREHRARTSPEFYPSVWYVDDHGGVRPYSADGFAWETKESDPLAELDREAVESAAARTAFVLAWADAEERAGRTYPGADLEDVAPSYTPGPFRAWARDVLSGAFGATTRGDGIAEQWARAKPGVLGHALALSCGGWTDGLGEADLPHPIGLPSLDSDARLFVDAAEFRADPPALEDLRALAKGTADPANVAERIASAIAEDAPADVLELADELLGGSGVESLDLPAPDEHEDAGRVRYVNLGDTYTATLCLVQDARTRGGRFLVADWGSLLEQAEGERTYATGEVRCPNCGEWTGAGSLDSEGGCDSCGWTN